MKGPEQSEEPSPINACLHTIPSHSTLKHHHASHTLPETQIKSYSRWKSPDVKTETFAPKMNHQKSKPETFALKMNLQKPKQDTYEAQHRTNMNTILRMSKFPQSPRQMHQFLQLFLCIEQLDTISLVTPLEFRVRSMSYSSSARSRNA